MNFNNFTQGPFYLELMNMVHINFLVLVQLMWVQDPRSSLEYSGLLTNTLNISFREKVTQNKIISHFDSLENN
jgi:hypothetical protein